MIQQIPSKNQLRFVEKEIWIYEKFLFTDTSKNDCFIKVLKINKEFSFILSFNAELAAQKQDDQLEHTFSSYVRIQDIVLKTYLGR